MSKKQALGQFFSTNVRELLEGFELPRDVPYVELCAGALDLVFYAGAERFGDRIYDVDPTHSSITKRDTLLNPVSLVGKFLMLNPPYLAKKKATDKRAFAKYGQDDLYKCYVKALINDPPAGGVLIVPLNFLCGHVKGTVNLRREFVQTFRVARVNVFEKQMFKDTTIPVCTILFHKSVGNTKKSFPAFIFRDQVAEQPEKVRLRLSERNNFTIGELRKYRSKHYTIKPCTAKSAKPNSALCLKAADTSRIQRLRMTLNPTTNAGSRTMKCYCITPRLSEADEKRVCKYFNKKLKKWRRKHHGLCLTAWFDNRRKRMNFSQAESLLNKAVDRL